MNKIFRLSILVVLAAFTLAQPAAALAASKKASSSKSSSRSKGIISRDPYIGAIVVDAASGKVLFEDNADGKGYPASTLKLIDLLIILEKVERRELSFQDPVPVSAKASKIGGTQVWLAQGECFTIDEMLYALMIQSANDAAVALAEKVAGSTDAFVQLMNQRAQALGMTSTVFHSVNGLPPSAGQEHDVTTARDFALLCREVLKHADTLRYTSTRERPFRTNVPNKTVVMRNHNHLLWNVPGCDGLKTGYITSGGYCLSATASRNNQRVIAIILGSRDRKARDAKAAELLAKGFASLSTSAPAAPRLPAAPTPVQPAHK